MMPSLLFALAIISQVLAIKITTPNATTNWTSPGPNMISWTTGSADPATFNIQLAQHDIASFTPNLALLADGIFGAAIPASALATVFVPSCVAAGARLPTGAGFTLRFLGEGADGSMALLATSQAFNITEASVTQCADLASTTGAGDGVPTMPGASSSSSSSAAAMGSGTAAVVSSGGLSTSTTASHLSTIIGSALGALILLLAGAAALWVHKARRDRRRKTAQFGMKVTQTIPQMQMQGRGQAREDV